ncbi:unnamed protein product [Rhizophagus irregularis]|nr:unnamed protein product [Rhizophagus irregularis]
MFKGLARINYLKRLTLYYLFLKEFATIQFIQSRRKVTPDLKLNKTAAFSKAELFFPLVQFQLKLTCKDATRRSGTASLRIEKCGEDMEWGAIEKDVECG